MKTPKQLVAALAFLALCGAASAQVQSSSGSQSAQGPTAVSEPGSLPLIVLGSVGAVAVGRFLKRRKNNKR